MNNSQRNGQRGRYTMRDKIIKEEPIEIKEEPTGTRERPCKLEENVTREDEETDNLIPLRPTQYGKLKFPPSCPVIHTNYSGSEVPAVVFGVVVAAYLDFESRDVVYKLETEELLTEKSLSFGKGARVWALPPASAEYVAAVVVHVTHSSTPEHVPSYSIQDLKSKVLHHFMSSDSVQYRCHGSSKPQALHTILEPKEQQPEAPTTDRTIRPMTTVNRSVCPRLDELPANPEMDHREKVSSSRPPCSLQTGRPPARADTKKEPEFLASQLRVGRSSREEPRTTNRSNHPSSTDYPSKRQKRTDNFPQSTLRHTLLLPEWTPVAPVTGTHRS
jgi:hypothetical protein